MSVESAATLAPTPDITATPQRGRWLGTFLVFGSLWAILIQQLRIDWSTNPQYSYGWFVPALAAYLFWKRWPSRPEPSRPAFRGGLIAAATVLALALLPTRLVLESNPDWSLAILALALEVIGLTLAILAALGGWATLRHFAWPVCFCLVAVAWPVRFETAITQGLMQHLAAITGELLSWAGVSAVPQGNLIRLPTGVVGVDEACSGVRSLQSMLMVSLFLGELHRLPTASRFLLLVIGLGLAVFFNIMRALILVTIALRSGLPALDKWHDSAGFSILVASFLVLCGVMRFFRPATPAERSDQTAWRPLPATAWGSLVVAIAPSVVVTEAWYRSHERPIPASQRWTSRWPTARAGFERQRVNDNVRRILSFSEGGEAVWNGADGSRWTMFFFEWHASRTSTQSARAHRPEICLPASGRTVVSSDRVVLVNLGEITIPFRSYVFDDRGHPLHVFFCTWEIGNRDLDLPGLLHDWSARSRLQRVELGLRNLGQQTLEVIVAGLDSSTDAEAAFREQMKDILISSALHDVTAQNAPSEGSRREP